MDGTASNGYRYTTTSDSSQMTATRPLLDVQPEILASAPLHSSDLVVSVLCLAAHLADPVVLLVQFRPHVLHVHKVQGQPLVHGLPWKGSGQHSWKCPFSSIGWPVRPGQPVPLWWSRWRLDFFYDGFSPGCCEVSPALPVPGTGSVKGTM